MRSLAPHVAALLPFVPEALTFAGPVPPSPEFYELWQLLRPAAEIRELNDGTLIDLTGQQRRALNFWQFQTFNQDEQVEFLHWLSISVHEYLHFFDLYASSFGFNVNFNNIAITAGFLRLVEGGARFHVPLLMKTQPDRDVAEWVEQYRISRTVSDAILGNNIRVKEVVERLPVAPICTFLPEGDISRGTPLIGMELDIPGVAEGITPVTTNHILEARALLAQDAYIARWFGASYADLYYNHIRKRAMERSDVLPYLLATILVNVVFGADNLPTKEVLFAILDLSLQVSPGPDRYLDSVCPPIVLVRLLGRLRNNHMTRANLTVKELCDFAETLREPIASPRTLFAQRKEFAERQVSLMQSESILDRVGSALNRMHADFMQRRLSNPTPLFSPGYFSELGLNNQLPHVPVEISRHRDFESLEISYDLRNDAFFSWYFLQSAMRDVLYGRQGLVCPIARQHVNCPVAGDSCGLPWEFMGAGEERCQFGHLLKALDINDRIVYD